MGYAQYLAGLLAPLGVYDLSDHSLSGGAVLALGTELDKIAAQLETAEREALAATAEGEGLDRRAALFARTPVATDPHQRRAALAALLRIDGDSFTPAAIDDTLRGCGIRARAREMDPWGNIRVTFPDTVGEPEGFAQIRQIILDILPCHLEVEFYFRYLTWLELEAKNAVWADVEALSHTWESFERWV